MDYIKSRSGNMASHHRLKCWEVSEVKLVNGFITGLQNPLSFDPPDCMHDTMRLNHLMPILSISKLNLCQVSQSLATALSLLKFQSATGSLSRLAG